MRATGIFPAALMAGLIAAVAPLNSGAQNAVAVQYHFAGTSDLSKDSNFENAGNILRSQTGTNFEALVLDRLSRVFWTNLQFNASGKPVETLRPLLDDLLQAESVASFGTGQDPVSFVLAVRLDKKHAESWRAALQASVRGNGESYSAEGFTGVRWSNELWMIQAPDWVLVGRGDGLASVRSDYLQQLQKTGRPWPALKDKWFQGVVDWSLLTPGKSVPTIPLKPARTTVDISASGGRFHVTAYMSYPDAVPWTAQPWRIPKDLVRQPLISFTAVQGIEPYMELNDVFSKLATDPFTNQFFCWGQKEMPFQSYMAWPVDNASNVLKNLGTDGLSLVNPILDRLDHSHLVWSPAHTEIGWTKSPLLRPLLRVAPGTDGSYLEAGLFFTDANKEPAPADLWAQFENRSDLVYYNWELTGARVHQWRLLCQLFPMMSPVSGRGNSAVTGKKADPPLITVENWLGDLEAALGNTVTEVSRTAPDELTVTRSAPFVFTGLELVWLSHWLADVPVGPVNLSLLPKSTISGPGVPAH